LYAVADVADDPLPHHHHRKGSQQHEKHLRQGFRSRTAQEFDQEVGEKEDDSGDEDVGDGGEDGGT
jgi:hypothetical protein